MDTKTVLAILVPQLGKPGLRTKRACSVDDVKQAIKATRSAKKRVRVYSSQGFVPNTYKYRCEIQYIEAICLDGQWQFRAGWTGAQRSFGNGSLIVVQ